MKVKFVDLPEVVTRNIWEEVCDNMSITRPLSISLMTEVFDYRLFEITGIKHYSVQEDDGSIPIYGYEFENEEHYIQTLLKYS